MGVTQNTIESALSDWVAKYFVKQGNLNVSDPTPTLQAIVGDAGFRQYYRLVNRLNNRAGNHPDKQIDTQVDNRVDSSGFDSPSDNPPMLAVYGPPETEKHERFVAIAEHLRVGGVRAPRIFAHDVERGFLLVEDLGATLLLPQLEQCASDSSAINGLYNRCFQTLLSIQSCAADKQLFAPYSATELRREMSLFTHWFVPKLLGYTTDTAEDAMIDACFDLLEASALSQPQVVVHRDFHARNIIFDNHSENASDYASSSDGGNTSGLGFGVIDFQDGVIGPVTYDLVSILRDCYIAWPQSQVHAWALCYRDMLQHAGLIVPMDDTVFVKAFDLMGLQRHIKVLGIFARLYLRDGKVAYLQDLPLVIAYTLFVAKQYPELASFVLWFETRLMPRIEKQDWYRYIALAA